MAQFERPLTARKQALRGPLAGSARTGLFSSHQKRQAPNPPQSDGKRTIECGAARAKDEGDSKCGIRVFGVAISGTRQTTVQQTPHMKETKASWRMRMETKMNCTRGAFCEK